MPSDLLKAILHILRSIIDSGLNHFLENVWAYVFSLLFGAAATVGAFYFTSPPIKNSEIRKRLLTAVGARLKRDTGRKIDKIELDHITTEILDLQSSQSIFTYGTGITRDNKFVYRFWAVFNPSHPNLFDRLVGRSGFYELGTFGFAQAPSVDALACDGVEIRDINRDGNKEILVSVSSTFADRRSHGFFILCKDSQDHWRFLSIPSICESMDDVMKNGTSKLKTIFKPIPFFGMKDAPPVAEFPDALKLIEGGMYEETWAATHDGVGVKFSTQSNGGRIEHRSHEVKGHPQIVVISFFRDESAVLAAHYAAINVFSVLEGQIARDTLWNWGYPMISIAPLKLSEVDTSSIMKAGIYSHKSDDTFFGFTEFERT